MVVTKPQKENSATYDFKCKIPLDPARLIMLADTDDMQNIFELTLDKKSYAFSCPTKQEFENWFNEIKTMKKELQKRKLEELQGKRFNNSKILSQPGAVERQQSLLLKKEEEERKRREEEERLQLEKQQQEEKRRIEQERKKQEEEERRKRLSTVPLETQFQDLDNFLEDLLDNFSSK